MLTDISLTTYKFKPTLKSNTSGYADQAHISLILTCTCTLCIMSEVHIFLNVCSFRLLRSHVILCITDCVGKRVLKVHLTFCLCTYTNLIAYCIVRLNDKSNCNHSVPYEPTCRTI